MDEVVENDEQIVLEKFDLEENFEGDAENDTATDDDELLDDEDVSKVALVDGDDWWLTKKKLSWPEIDQLVACIWDITSAL